MKHIMFVISAYDVLSLREKKKKVLPTASFLFDEVFKGEVNAHCASVRSYLTAFCAAQIWTLFTCPFVL